VPPAYYDSGRYKKESRNKFSGSQKGHNQYLQNGVVRFELPYHGTCTGCGTPVGKGTRFNATKRQAGNYLTSPIWEFIMKCRKCAKVEFCIRTNPKEQSFDYLGGIQKKTTEFDTVHAGTAGVIETDANGNHKIVPSCEAGTVNIGSHSNVDTRPSAPSSLTRLETIASGKRQAMTEYDQLKALQQLNSQTFENDALSNADIRKEFRKDRNRKKKRLESGKALGWKEGMQLEDSILEDTVTARNAVFRDCKATEQTKFRNARESSIFSSTSCKLKKRKKKQRSLRCENSLVTDNGTFEPDGCISNSRYTKVGKTKIKVENPLNPMKRKSPNLLVFKRDGPTTVNLKISPKKHLDSSGSKGDTLVKNEQDTTPPSHLPSPFGALVNYESSSDSE